MNKIWRKLTALNNVPDFNEISDNLRELAENTGHSYYNNGKAGQYNLKDSNSNIVLVKVSLTEIHKYLSNLS